MRSLQDPNKVFDVQGANRQAGARVIAYSDKNDFSDNQLWYEDQRGVIRSKLNGFSLCATGDASLRSIWLIKQIRFTKLDQLKANFSVV